MYDKIKAEDLDVPCMMGSYSDGDELMTIREKLDQLNLHEDLIAVDYVMEDTTYGPRLDKFIGWTDTYIILKQSFMVDEFFIIIPRNPPQEV